MTHFRSLLLSLLLIPFGCSSDYVDDTNLEPIPSKELQEKSGSTLKKGGLPGDQCATGCIWSLFSVAIGVQDASHDCDGFGCACVMDGYVYQECEVESQAASSPPVNYSAEASLAGTCAPGCIWSKFAVDIGAQNGSAQCETGPCACVAMDNVYVECAPSSSNGSASNSHVPDTRRPASPSPQPRASGQPRHSVPYFYQYNNRYEPSGTCQNTSMAMVLRYYGWGGTPDEITSRYGRRYAQSPGGLADLFNRLASEKGLSQRLRAHTNGRMSDVRRLLDQGKPVIIHGYFTGYGHVVVITGYDSGGYYVNDPAGRWTETFKGGYGGGYGATAGQNVYYGKAAFEAAVATSDGWNFMPIWYHELR